MARFYVDHEDGSRDWFETRPAPLPERPRPPEPQPYKVWKLLGVLVICLAVGQCMSGCGGGDDLPEDPPRTPTNCSIYPRPLACI